MQRRRVGRTSVELSVVGFGTCQLRLVPEEQAVAALRRGFELGVDWVHVSPDYEGAADLARRAAHEAGRRVLLLGDGSGDERHFERCFEAAQRANGPGPLPLWGISCIDDQEFVGRDVWGRGGMVEFLAARKRDGSLLAAYCTTHGPPDYVAELVTSGCFDAIMLAWNPLGFHVLTSYAASEGKRYEDLEGTRTRVFPLAREHGVSLLVMKALAGGLLGQSRAFPPRALLAEQRAQVRATDVLRHVLAQEGVTAVVPGTGCVEEAEENALAGHAPLVPEVERDHALLQRVAEMRLTLCSRCGACEPTCSRGLPISWLFREAYVWLNPGDTFDAAGRLHYFHLHPETALACASCTERTCECPQGLDVPLQLQRVHDSMLDLRAAGVLPRTPAELEGAAVGEDPAVLVVQRELPERVVAGERARVRLWLENAGTAPWSATGEQRASLDVVLGGRVVQRADLREDVHPGTRAHFVLDLEPLEVPSDEPAGPVLLVLRAGAGRCTEIARLFRGIP